MTSHIRVPLSLDQSLVLKKLTHFKLNIKVACIFSLSKSRWEVTLLLPLDQSLVLKKLTQFKLDIEVPCIFSLWKSRSWFQLLFYGLMLILELIHIMLYLKTYIITFLCRMGYLIVDSWYPFVTNFTVFWLRCYNFF